MSKKILIIDDDPDVAEVLSEHLETLGYDFEIKGTCREGLESLESNDYLAVFTDYMMPDIKGDSLIKEISGKYPRLKGKLFLITGASVDEELERRIASEGGSVIRKPFTKEVLIEAVKKI